MELFFIFTGAFAVALSGALIPGPMLTVTVFHSLKTGFRAGPLVTLGHAAAELTLLALIILGLGGILARPAVMRVVFTAGGLLLIVTAAFMLKASNNLSLEIKSPGDSSAGGPFLSGLITSVSNPTWTLWWVTIGITYLTKALEHGPAGIAAFFSGHILADFGWYGFISLAVSRGKSRISPGAYRKFISVCGAALGCFGAWFLLQGVL